MGLQSAMGNITFGRLPSMLQSRGLSPAQAGAPVGLAIIVQASVAMFVSAWAGRVDDHRLALAGEFLLYPVTVVVLC